MNVNDNARTASRKGAPRLLDAVKPLGPTDQPHEMRDPFDIGDALAQLSDAGDPVTLYAEGQDEPLMARIDSVDPELPHFVLDLAGNAILPRGQALLLVASVGNNAKLQCHLPDDWQALVPGGRLVRASFPEVCLVLNRRAQRRRELPLGGNYTVTFVTPNQKHVLQLCDFSTGGIGMRAAPTQTRGLHVGKKLQGVRLDIGEESLTVDMVIRLTRRFRTFLLGEQVQIGCKFENLTPETEHKLRLILAAYDAERRGPAD